MPEIRVLVADDDAAARDLLVAILEDDGYEVRPLADGPAALAASLAFQPDLALVGGGLQGMDGAEVARRLRQVNDIPIIFVTEADSAEDIHSAFRMGADDHVVKPFDPEELSWRVRAVLRRSGRTVVQAWECGDLIVDEGAHSVTVAGLPVALTATEFRLLCVLVRNRTRVVPKGQLGRELGHTAGGHVLEVHISALRRKLEARGPRRIHTVRGTGYVLRA